MFIYLNPFSAHDDDDKKNWINKRTSSTWACVCCSLFCAAICCGPLGPPTISPFSPDAGASPPSGGAAGAPPSVDL